MRLFAGALIVLVAGTAIAFGQNGTAPSFEVATVKPSPPNPTPVRFSDVGPPPPGHWRAQRVNLIQLITLAYPKNNFDGLVTGGPSWAHEMIFDVEGQMDPKTPQTQVAAMVATLLSERFALRYHTEQRLVAVYVLKLARSDGRLGPQMTPSAEPCVQARLAQRPLPPECRAKLAARSLPALQIDDYIQYLAIRKLDRPIINRTGLTGYFDFNLTYGCGPFAVSSPCTGDSVSLFTAFQEQAGLKLEPGREMVDVIAIDSAKIPEPD